MTLETVSNGPADARARIRRAAPPDRGWAYVGVKATDGLQTDTEMFRITILEPRAGSTMLLLHREPAPANEWGTLQFRSREGVFLSGGDGGGVEVVFESPPAKADEPWMEPVVRLSCLPALRPACLSDPVNVWRLSFRPPLGQTLARVRIIRRATPDSVNVGFTLTQGHCRSYTPSTATLEIRQVERGASEGIARFWARVRHEPDASSGLFETEVRFQAQLPVSIEAPSRMEAHAGVPLEVPLRIGATRRALPRLIARAPPGAALEITSDSSAVFRWVPGWDDKGFISCISSRSAQARRRTPA